MLSECTNFVILAAPRTGSNMLCTMLNSHPGILCHHEVFNPQAIYYALNLREGEFNLGTVAQRDRDPVEFIRRLWTSRLGHACVGFKMTRGQNQVALQEVLRDRQVKKIVLRRHNRVKTYVSWLIAERTGQWEAYRAADIAGSRPMVWVDETALREHNALNDQYYLAIERELRETGQRALDVAYEDLFGHAERLRVLRFLGSGELEDAGLAEPRSVKQNASDLRELVCNFEELASAWSGTSLGEQLQSREN